MIAKIKHNQALLFHRINRLFLELSFLFFKLFVMFAILPSQIALAQNSSPQPARHALIIGNSLYDHFPQLDNPQNDATDIARYLKSMGFHTTVLLDMKKSDTAREVTRFLASLHKDDTALLYYSGHAVQVQGQNYLVAADTPARNDHAILKKMINLNQLVSKLESRTGTNLIFLDACRNNPFVTQNANNSGDNSRSAKLSRGLLVVDAGLAPISTTSGETLLIYSALSGQTASDGTNRRNSPFTEALLRHIQSPNLEVEVMLKRVTRDVKNLTNDVQTPERLSRLTTEFYFNKKKIAQLSPSLIQPRTPNGENKKVTGSSFKDCSNCPEMTVLPSGNLKMGSTTQEDGHNKTESPVHQVSIPYRLAISKREITFAQWQSCVASGGCRGYTPDDHGWGRGNLPVINVSWLDTQHYLKWLNARTGQNYRLLSEAEWEYAARGGKQSAYSTGNTLTTRQANFDGSTLFVRGRPGKYRKKTVSVGSFRANTFGLYDMSGNVMEWVQDCWHPNYQDAPINGKARDDTPNCKARVLRGGSWYYENIQSRSAARKSFAPTTRLNMAGFRIARPLPN